MDGEEVEAVVDAVAEQQQQGDGGHRPHLLEEQRADSLLEGVDEKNRADDAAKAEGNDDHLLEQKPGEIGGHHEEGGGDEKVAEETKGVEIVTIEERTRREDEDEAAQDCASVQKEEVGGEEEKEEPEGPTTDTRGEAEAEVEDLERKHEEVATAEEAGPAVEEPKQVSRRCEEEKEEKREERDEHETTEERRSEDEDEDEKEEAEEEWKRIEEEEKERRRQEEEEKERQRREAAAVLIERVWRGWCVRRMHAKRRAAAVRIQARWRGCLARKAFKPLWSSRHLAKLRPVESAPLSHLQLGKPAPNSPTIRRRTPSRGHHKKTKSITRNEAACLISTEAEEPPAPAPSAAKPAVGHVERAATPPAPVAVAVAGATPKEQKTSEPGVEEPKRIRLVPLGAPGFAFDPTQVTLRKAPVTRPEGGAAGSPGGAEPRVAVVPRARAPGAVAMANLRESLKKPLGQDEPVKTGMVSEEESSVLKVLRRHSAQDMKTLLVPKQDTGTVLRRKASREAPDDLSRSASHFTFALPSTEARVAALHQSLGGARPTPVVPMAKMVSNDLFSSANLPKRVSFSKNASPRSTVNLRGRQPGAAESPSGLAGQPTLQDTTEAAKLQANVAAGQTQHFDSPLPSLESSPSGSPSEGSPIAARLSAPSRERQPGSPMPQRPLGAPPATPPTPASSASVFTPAHPRTKSGSFAPLMGRRGALMGSTSSIASSSASAQPHDWPQRRKSASELLLVFFKKRKTKEELIERGIFVEVDGEPGAVADTGGDQVGRLQAQRECTVCKESVRASLFKSQHKVCPRCKASVCKKCVTKRKYPLPGWKDKRAVCLLCLPEVDKTFE